MRQDEKDALLDRAQKLFARIENSYDRASEEIQNNAGRALLIIHHTVDRDCEEFNDLLERVSDLGSVGEMHGLMCDAHEMLGILANAQVDDTSYTPARKYDPQVRHSVWSLTDGHCAYCDVRLGDDWHVDHVVPVAHGGPDSLANYVPACKSCNISKNCGHVVNFIKKRQGKPETKNWRQMYGIEEGSET